MLKCHYVRDFPPAVEEYGLAIVNDMVMFHPNLFLILWSEKQRNLSETEKMRTVLTVWELSGVSNFLNKKELAIRWIER